MNTTPDSLDEFEPTGKPTSTVVNGQLVCNACGSTSFKLTSTSVTCSDCNNTVFGGGCGIVQNHRDYDG